MTSASYSAQRSELARSLGLGQPRRAPAPEPEETVVQDDAPVSEKPKRAGRPRKAATA